MEQEKEMGRGSSKAGNSRSGGGTFRASITEAYNRGEIDQGTFGQLAARNFTSESIMNEVDRGNISNSIARKVVGHDPRRDGGSVRGAVMKAYYAGDIDAGVMGQMASFDFSRNSVRHAYNKGWINRKVKNKIIGDKD